MLSGRQPVTFALPRLTLPLVGARSPDSTWVRVDLPAPLGPMTAWMRPCHRSIDTSFTAASPPKSLVRLRAESRTSVKLHLLAAPDAFHHTEQSAWSEDHHQDDEQAHPQLPVLA